MNTNQNDITVLASKLRQTVATLNGMIVEIESHGKLLEENTLSGSDRRLLDLIRDTRKSEDDRLARLSDEQTQRMVLIATDCHVASGHPVATWVHESDAIEILSPTYQPADRSLEALKLAFFRTKAGEQSKWYIKAGPVALAELTEWCESDDPNKGSLPPSIQSRTPQEAV